MVLKKETDPKIRKEILTYHLSSVMTDSERAVLLGLPEGCRIRENAKIISPENLKCGTNVWIGEGAIIDASGGLEIGDNMETCKFCDGSGLMPCEDCGASGCDSCRGDGEVACGACGGFGRNVYDIEVDGDLADD